VTQIELQLPQVK